MAVDDAFLRKAVKDVTDCHSSPKLGSLRFQHVSEFHLAVQEQFMRLTKASIDKKLFHVVSFVLSISIGLAQSVTASPSVPNNLDAASYAATKTSPPALNYTTSWIGNSFGGGNYGPNQLTKHVPIDIDGIYVTASGAVYTNTGWDEGGRALTTFKDGDIINPLNSVNTNNGGGDNLGGFAVAADDKYVYEAIQGTGTGIEIKNVSDHSDTGLNLTGSSNLTTTAEIYGIALLNKKLYVTETDLNRVEVFDTDTRKLVSSMAIPGAARIAVDCLGGIWVSHLDPTVLPHGDTWGKFGTPVIDHYNAEGVLLNSLSLPDDSQVTALWIDFRGKDGQDRLFVGDDGPDQNVKIYTSILWGHPRLTATFGRKGGVYAGDADDRGKVGPYRFHGITGVGTDAHGNIYIGENEYGPSFACCTSNGRGAVVQGYALGDVDEEHHDDDGEQTEENYWGRHGSHLNWSLDGLEFVAMTTIDPGTGTDAFDAYHHFRMDWSAAAGKEAKYVADTTDPVRYPDDIRLTNNGNDNGQSGEVWRIRGRRFLFVQSQSGSYIAIYRFDEAGKSDVAIPCGGLSHGTSDNAYNDWVNQPQSGEFIWRDLNGDGKTEPDEFAQPPNAQGRANGGGLWYVDADGNIWEIAPDLKGDNSTQFRRYLFQGFDHNGAPIYDYDHVDFFAPPSDFTDAQSVQFDVEASSGGTLYIAGDQFTSSYAGQFTKLARYDHWNEGNRKPTWITTTPFDPDPNNPWQPHQFAFVGSYMFVDYEIPHYILVYSLQDGSYVGELVPGANIGGPVNVGNTDIWQSISAYERPDGEYIVNNEDDYQAKTIMYRWDAKSTSKIPLPAPPSGLVGTGTDEGANLSWNTVPGGLTYQVLRSSQHGGPYALVANGIFTPSYSDVGLKNGQTYYYVISVQSVTGISAYSNEVTVTAMAAGTTYEAEASILANGGFIASCPNTCSGGARVGGVGAGVTLTFPKITVSVAGIYAVRVYYGNGDNNPADFSPMDVTPNSGVPGVIASYAFTGDWSIPTYTSVNLPLKAGSNSIILGVPAGSPGGGPDIDRLLVPFDPN
jgi:hypothetical protein